MKKIYKSINLIYSSFDDNESIPNGYDIFTENGTIYFDSYFHFETHLNDRYDSEVENRKFILNKKSLDSTSNILNNFFIISHPTVNYEFISNDRFRLSDELIKKVKDGNLYLIFLQEHETCWESEFVDLCEKLKSLDIPLSRVVLINNNSKLEEYKKKYQYDVLVHRSNFLYFSFTKTLKMLESKWISDKQGKFFMTRNRNPKSHRVTLLANLFFNDIIDDVNWSLIPNEGFDFGNYELYKDFFDKEFIDKNEKIFKYIETTKKEDDFEKGKGWINLDRGEFTHQKDFHLIYHIPEHSPSFENSYFNIVTESTYKSKFNNIHITEKSLRPFYFYQFPIFVSTPHHIKYLKKDYDFDLFDDIIDHSYDNEIDDKKRMEMIVSEIKRIHNNKEFFIEFYKNNRDRFEHNRKVFLERGFSAKKYDLDFFWNL